MKKIVLFLLISLFSSTSFAGYLLPEIKRNRKELNDAALGVIWQKRKGVAANLTYISSDTDRNGVAQTELSGPVFMPYGFYNVYKFSFEGGFAYGKQEATTVSTGTTSDLDYFSPTIFTGFRLNDHIGFALGASNFSVTENSGGVEEKSDKTQFEAGASFRPIKELFLGIELQVTTLSNERSSGANDPDLDYLTVMLGAGYKSYNRRTKHGYGGEVVFYSHGEDEEIQNSTRYYLYGEKGLILSGTYRFPKIEVSAEAIISKEEQTTLSREKKTKSIELETEVMITNNIYITPKLSYSKKESTGTSTIETKETLLGFAGGFRNKMLDASLDLLYESTDQEYTSSTTKFETGTLMITGNVAYFF